MKRVRVSLCCLGAALLLGSVIVVVSVNADESSNLVSMEKNSGQKSLGSSTSREETEAKSKEEDETTSTSSREFTASDSQSVLPSSSGSTSDSGLKGNSQMPRATSTEKSDISLAGQALIIQAHGRSGVLANVGSDLVGLLSSGSWTFKYTGSADDAFYITNDGGMFLTHSGTTIKRGTSATRNSEWRVIKISAGYKIMSVDSPSYCISWSGNGDGNGNNSVVGAVFKGSDNQIWSITSVDTNYAKKVFYVPVNTKEVIGSGSGSGSITWYSGNSIVGTGTDLTVLPTVNDTTPKRYIAKRGDEVLRDVWVVPEKYTFSNQNDYSHTITLLSPVKTWSVPKELQLPAKTYRWNDTAETLEPYTISTIGNSAFANSAIEKVKFPKEVDRIENLAFTNCSKLKTIEYLSSDVICGINIFKDTIIGDITTDDPARLSARLDSKALGNYKGKKLVIWKEGDIQGYSTAYTSNVTSDNTFSEGDELSLAFNVTYPLATYLRTPLDSDTTTFKSSVDNWQDYHTYQWYKDGEVLDGQISPNLKLSSLKTTDSGSYYATVDGQTVEGDKKINVKVKVDNTNPKAPEPSNPDSWINVELPAHMEFHSTSQSNYSQIQGRREQIINHSGRPVRIDVSGIKLQQGGNGTNGIKSLKLNATRGEDVDLKNFESGKESRLVVLGNSVSSTNTSLVSIEGSVNTDTKKFRKYELGLTLKFIPLKQDGNPYS
jgi:hypothetical protein